MKTIRVTDQMHIYQYKSTKLYSTCKIPYVNSLRLNFLKYIILENYIVISGSKKSISFYSILSQLLFHWLVRLNTVSAKVSNWLYIILKDTLPAKVIKGCLLS